jgi:flagellar protein FlaG
MNVTPLHNSQIVAPSPVPASNDQQAENLALVQAVQAINAAELYGEQGELSFALDRRTQRGVVRLIERKTKQVIREVPPDQVLSLAESLEPGDR